MDSQIPHYFTKAREDGVIFCFRGPMTQSLVENLENTLKLRVEQEGTDTNTTLKVFSIFVEQVQNVIHYSEDRTPPQEPGGIGFGLGIVLIGRKDGQFFVSCGNLIKNTDAPRMEEKLVKIKGMDKKQLRTYFKERIRSDPEEGSKGAGLGLIDMARKSRDIDFSFTLMDDVHTLFSIQVTI